MLEMIGREKPGTLSFRGGKVDMYTAAVLLLKKIPRMGARPVLYLEESISFN
jgi:hypothetical protein